MPRDEREDDEYQGPWEIAIAGELSDNASELTQKLLDVPPGDECILYFDCPGGSAYTALSLMSILRLRRLQAVGVVTGECSSAALWPFAACTKRLVTPYSVLLFHPMRWQSEEHVQIAEAAEWARHFGTLEQTMDDVLAELLNLPAADLKQWMDPGRYVSGKELAATGAAQLIGLDPLEILAPHFSSSNDRSGRRR